MAWLATRGHILILGRHSRVLLRITLRSVVHGRSLHPWSHHETWVRLCHHWSALLHVHHRRLRLHHHGLGLHHHHGLGLHHHGLGLHHHLHHLRLLLNVLLLLILLRGLLLWRTIYELHLHVDRAGQLCFVHQAVPLINIQLSEDFIELDGRNPYQVIVHHFLVHHGQGDISLTDDVKREALYLALTPLDFIR